LQNDIPDGRIIRIVGEEKEQNVPLMRNMTAGEYDIIVSEAPTTPNERERVWALMQPLMPMLPPQLQLKMLKYSPLPEAAVQELQDGAAEAMQNQPPPPEQAKAEAEMQMMQAKGQMDMQKAQMDLQAKAQEAELRRAEMEAQLLFEQQKMEMERQKMAMQLQHEEQKLAVQMQRDQRKMAMEAERDEYKFGIEIQQADFDMENARQRNEMARELMKQKAAKPNGA
jgi:hypothetical protein